MKATELRVNNWYNSTKFQIPIMCEFADFAELNARADGAKVDESLIDEMFQSILLTEEWLLKFGFVWSGTQLVYMDKKSGWFWLVKKDDTYKLWYYENSIGKQFEYVHQLQNLYFALTGNELEIK